MLKGASQASSSSLMIKVPTLPLCGSFGCSQTTAASLPLPVPVAARCGCGKVNHQAVSVLLLHWLQEPDPRLVHLQPRVQAFIRLDDHCSWFRRLLTLKCVVMGGSPLVINISERYCMARWPHPVGDNKRIHNQLKTESYSASLTH